MNKVKKFCKELKYSFGVNSWYMKIQVKKGSENTADVLIDHRYNTIELTLYDAFFLATPEFQADTLIHEFCHLFNSPVFNLLNEQNAGKLVTQYHAEDILEQANARAERTIVYILNNRDLAKAYREYITPEKKLRSVSGRQTKRSPKMPQKVIKKKTGTR